MKVSKGKDHDGYKAPYETPYKMMDGFAKLMHDADGNKILYQASLHNLSRLGCYASRLIPKVQCRQGKLGPSSKPCMMVGYTHDSTTLLRIWDPEFQKIKPQREVVFNEERNAHMSCRHGSNEFAIFELSEDEEYVEETDTGDGPLRDSQPTQISKRSKSHIHKAPDEEAENAHSLRLHGEDQTTQHSAANAENTNIRHLRRVDQAGQHSPGD
jgi:hypothetical protein